MLEVTILAILQGIAEFLPISSSGHLVIGQNVLGLGDIGMRLNIFLHLGTLFSISVFYFSTLRAIVSSGDWRYCLKVLLSSVPAVAAYFLFGEFVDSAFSDVGQVGALLVFTGFVLVGTRFLPQGGKDVDFLRALIMGVGQALALLPGVSRSGMTLAAARACSVAPEKSAEFSFLMSMPLIAGAAAMEIQESCTGEAVPGADVSWPLAVYGCVVSAVVGYFALKLLVMLLKGKWFWLFGPYCILAGLATLLCR